MAFFVQNPTAPAGAVVRCVGLHLPPAFRPYSPHEPPFQGRLPCLRPAQPVRHGGRRRPAGLLVHADPGVPGGAGPSARAGERPALHLSRLCPRVRSGVGGRASATPRAFMIDFLPPEPPHADLPH